MKLEDPKAKVPESVREMSPTVPKQQGTSTLEVNDSDSDHEAAVVRRSRRPSQKLREASDAQRSLYEQQGRQDVTQAVTNNDIMALLLQMKNESIRKEEENKEKEEKYQKEIENLRAMVTSLTFDIKSLQNASPNWGPLIESDSAESPVLNQGKSYAEVASAGMSLQQISTSSQSSKSSRVSFNPRTSSSDSSPRRSPPQISMATSIRSAMKSTTSEQNKKETTLAIDLKDLEKGLGEQGTRVQDVRTRIERALRSIEGLENLRLQDFRVRHTNQEVNFARFRVPKDAEILIR